MKKRPASCESLPSESARPFSVARLSSRANLLEVAENIISDEETENVSAADAIVSRLRAERSLCSTVQAGKAA